MMIYCYYLNGLVSNLLFIAFISKTHVWMKNWEKDKKIEKNDEIQSSRTNVQILKTFDGL